MIVFLPKTLPETLDLSYFRFRLHQQLLSTLLMISNVTVRAPSLSETAMSLSRRALSCPFCEMSLASSRIVWLQDNATVSPYPPLFHSYNFPPSFLPCSAFLSSSTCLSQTFTCITSPMSEIYQFYFPLSPLSPLLFPCLENFSSFAEVWVLWALSCSSVVLSVDWKLLVWYSVWVRHVAAEHANNDVCDFDWCLTMFYGHWVVDNASKLWRISSLVVGRLFFYCARDFRRRRAVVSLRSDRFLLLTTSPLWSGWSRWHSSYSWNDVEYICMHILSDVSGRVAISCCK